LRKARFVDDWDPTDRVLVIVHGADSSEHHDDSPTSPIVTWMASSGMPSIRE